MIVTFQAGQGQRTRIENKIGEDVFVPDIVDAGGDLAERAGQREADVGIAIPIKIDVDGRVSRNAVLGQRDIVVVHAATRETHNVAGSEILDRVAVQIGRRTFRHLGHEHVATGTTGQAVGPETAVDEVRTVTALDLVAAVAPQERVISRAAVQAVVAATALDVVTILGTGDDIVPGATVDPRTDCRPADRIVTGRSSAGKIGG